MSNYVLLYTLECKSDIYEHQLNQKSRNFLTAQMLTKIRVVTYKIRVVNKIRVFNIFNKETRWFVYALYLMTN